MCVDAGMAGRPCATNMVGVACALQANDGVCDEGRRGNLTVDAGQNWVYCDLGTDCQVPGVARGQRVKHTGVQRWRADTHSTVKGLQASALHCCCSCLGGKTGTLPAGHPRSITAGQQLH